MVLKQRLFSTLAAASALALLGCASPNYYQPTGGAYPAGAPVSNAGYAQFGRVADVRFLQGNGSSGVAGTVIGGAVGGLAGHQVGGGSGKTAATIGRAVEQNSNRGGQGVYRVTVQMEDGGTRSFDYAEPPNVQVGERVRVDGNQLYR